jgi:hypothetical protein
MEFVIQDESQAHEQIQLSLQQLREVYCKQTVKRGVGWTKPTTCWHCCCFDVDGFEFFIYLNSEKVIVNRVRGDRKLFAKHIGNVFRRSFGEKIREKCYSDAFYCQQNQEEVKNLCEEELQHHLRSCIQYNTQCDDIIKLIETNLFNYMDVNTLYLCARLLQKCRRPTQQVLSIVSQLVHQERNSIFFDEFYTTCLLDALNKIDV